MMTSVTDISIGSVLISELWAECSFQRTPYRRCRKTAIFAAIDDNGNWWWRCWGHRNKVTHAQNAIAVAMRAPVRLTSRHS